MPLRAPCSDVRLAPEAVASGYRLIALDSTESTNDEAAAAARHGDPGRLWIVAGEQRAGRGRHGRQWTSPPGNLYASLLLVDPCEPAVDRKSTRLNSSHANISYAVFCLKKKN